MARYTNHATQKFKTRLLKLLPENGAETVEYLLEALNMLYRQTEFDYHIERLQQMHCVERGANQYGKQTLQRCKQSLPV